MTLFAHRYRKLLITTQPRRIRSTLSAPIDDRWRSNNCIFNYAQFSLDISSLHSCWIKPYLVIINGDVKTNDFVMLSFQSQNLREEPCLWDFRKVSELFCFCLYNDEISLTMMNHKEGGRERGFIRTYCASHDCAARCYVSCFFISP